MRAEPVVYILDADEKIRAVLRTLLAGSQRLCAPFASARAFLDQFEPNQPGCLVLDPALPEISGFELQERLGLYDVAPPMIFMSSHPQPDAILHALRRGALDYFEKPLHSPALLKRIEEALARDELNRRQFAWYSQVQARAAELTDREREVLHFVVAGLSNRLTSERLKVTRKAVEAYRGRLMRKLRAHSIPELVRIHVMLMCGPNIVGGSRPARLLDELGVPLQFNLLSASPPEPGRAARAAATSR